MSAADWGRAYLAGEGVRARAFADAVLAPAEAAYRAWMGLRRRAYEAGVASARTPALPVLSVGNLVVGGAGKTPVAAFLATRLADRGARPAIVHGGYAPDEPLLHRAWNPGIPVFIGRDRHDAVRRAAAAGADIAVLDDGFQHLRLRRDLDLVLVPVERWRARPRLLPRGPWREPPAALRRAGLVGLTHRGADPGRVADVRAAVAALTAAPVAELVLETVGWRRLAPRRPEGAAVGAAGEAGPAEPALGVCALADPEGFRRSAERAGASIASLLTYGDHHAYDASDLDRILRGAAGRPIVTTEKDAVKLGPLAGRAPVWVLAERVRPAAGADEVDRALGRLIA